MSLMRSPKTIFSWPIISGHPAYTKCPLEVKGREIEDFLKRVIGWKNTFCLGDFSELPMQCP